MPKPRRRPAGCRAARSWGTWRATRPSTKPSTWSTCAFGALDWKAGGRTARPRKSRSERMVASTTREPVERVEIAGMAVARHYGDAAGEYAAAHGGAVVVERSHE